jgi:SAM-dependent methyltransferase
VDDWRSFDRVAEVYERVEAPYVVDPARDLLQLVGAREGERLLDVGAGTGVVAGVAAGEGVTAVGVDPSLGMLAIARRERPSLPVAAAEAIDLPFRDGSFDAVVGSFVLASFLATAGGVVYVLLITRADPSVTTPSFTLALLLMVVIGGTGTRWGAVLGAMLYTFLDHRLPDWSSSPRIQDLPDALSKPLSQPLFVLGTLFILLVYFLPGGLIGLARLGPRRGGLETLEQAVDIGGTHGDVQEEEEVARL